MPYGGVNALHEETKSRNRRERRLCMRFFPQGAAAVDPKANKGRGASIVRTGVGRFDVTFDGPYPDLFHAMPRVAHATLLLHAMIAATATSPQGVTGVTIQVYDNTGIAADVAAAPTSWVSFEIVLAGTKETGI